MDVSCITDKGKYRKNNEDAFLNLKDNHVFAVADGVGGQNAGEIASKIAVRSLAMSVEKETPPKGDHHSVASFFRRAYWKANMSILNFASNDDTKAGMATTLVCAYVDKNYVYIFNTGDSRAYLWREGRLGQITKDHTYVYELLRGGYITEEEARNHKDGHVITQALGVQDFNYPDYFLIEVKADDVILLSSDGLHGELSNSKISRLIQEDDDAEKINHKLLDAALEAGGRDNITIISIKMTEEDFHE